MINLIQYTEQYITGLKNRIDHLNMSAHFDQYSNVFDLALGFSKRENIKRLYEKSDEYPRIVDIVNSFNKIGFIYLNETRHHAVTGELTEPFLPNLIILYTKAEGINKNEVSILNLTIGDETYEASLILNPSTSFNTAFMFGSEIKESINHEILKNDSWLRFDFIIQTENNEIYKDIIICKESNSLLHLDSKSLLNSNVTDQFSDLDVKDMCYSGNTVALHGDRYLKQYLKESYRRKILWYNLSENEVIFKTINEDSYNAR